MEDGTRIRAQESHMALFVRFLRFGLLAWGGPIAQIAMIRQELVEEEKWVTNERFNRVLGVYQALPGPEAHEMCVYFGMTAGGRFGGVLAGLGFMLPGFVLMFALSWFYVTYGMSLPLFKPVFHGFQAAVGALIVRAIHRIGGHSLTDVTLWIVAGLAAIGEITGVPFFISLPVLGLTYFLVSQGRRVPGYLLGVLFVAGIFLFWQYAAPQGAVVSAGTQNLSLRAASLPELFLSGLRSGLLTFGGAYTVITFLQHDAVNVQNWMTNAQFLDGLALSGILPAPLIIFATFVGYFAGGPLGGLIMTAGIFLPAFAFTLIGHNVMEKAIDSPRLHAFLEGVTAAVVGLMAVTTVKLLKAGIDDWPSLGIFVAALLAVYLWKSKLAIAFIVLGAGTAGLLMLR
ncbi:MAG: chromate efflux transporter [Syntrophobacteraceae bacterium]|nr:chromate efflux transporter [Syntrophobacteraceae bacterium]